MIRRKWEASVRCICLFDIAGIWIHHKAVIQTVWQDRGVRNSLDVYDVYKEEESGKCEQKLRSMRNGDMDSFF